MLGGGGSVEIEVFTCILCILRTGLYLFVDILCYLSELVVECRSIFRSEVCWTCALMRIDPSAEDVEYAGDILDRGRWVQFARRPESMIWSIGRGQRKVVSRCWTAEGGRRIFEETFSCT